MTLSNITTCAEGIGVRPNLPDTPSPNTWHPRHPAGSVCLQGSEARPDRAHGPWGGLAQAGRGPLSLVPRATMTPAHQGTGHPEPSATQNLKPPHLCLLVKSALCSVMKVKTILFFLSMLPAAERRGSQKPCHLPVPLGPQVPVSPAVLRLRPVAVVGWKKIR